MKNPKVRLLGGLVVGVVIMGLLAAAGIAFLLGPTSPGVTIQGEGYVIDAPDVPGQMYLLQEDGTTTIIVPGE